MAVMMPTGISAGPDLASVSAITKNIAPANALVGSRILWSDPTMSRMKCGIISPTNPMTPETETATAVRILEMAKSILFVCSTFTPKLCAFSSPK